ncbi:MAG: hypothetical protein ACYC5M_12785 [Anaerolineae bacterium]
MDSMQSWKEVQHYEFDGNLSEVEAVIDTLHRFPHWRIVTQSSDGLACSFDPAVSQNAVLLKEPPWPDSIDGETRGLLYYTSASVASDISVQGEHNMWAEVRWRPDDEPECAFYGRITLETTRPGSCIGRLFLPMWVLWVPAMLDASDGQRTDFQTYLLRCWQGAIKVWTYHKANPHIPLDNCFVIRFRMPGLRAGLLG